MIGKPRFKSSYHVELTEPEGVFLLSEQSYFLLHGELYCRLARLIDGRRTADDIVEELAGEVAPVNVYYALNRLQHLGFITEASSSSIPTGVSAFWELLDLDPRLTDSQLQQATVSVIQIGDFPLEPFKSSLDALNIQRGQYGDLSVIVTDDYLREEIRDTNITALTSGRPWLIVKPVGAVLWIGPVFRPGITACWECLAHRIRTNRLVESYLDSRREGTTPFPISRAALPATLQIAYNLAAIETAKLIVRGLAQPGCQLTTFNCLNWETQTHTVVRRPQCHRCGNLTSRSNADPVPMVLQSKQSRFTADGGYRTVSPEQTFAQYKHHISPITGAVSHLHSLRTDDSPYMHVYNANHNPAAKTDKLFFLRKGLRANSGGKGATDAQAKTSALCEALERYSGIFQGDEVRKRASYKQLGDRAIHPNRCMLFSENQYRGRRELNKRQLHAFHRIADPLNEDDDIEWTPVWSLTHHQTQYVPTSYCYYDYPSQGASYCFADSNGNAAGNTLEEAILQGLLELVERDSVALWWYNRVRRPKVDLECFDEPYIRALVKYFETLERDLWVLDLSSDLSIPVFAAVSRRNNDLSEEITLGCGAHLDPRIGVLRSLTELTQFLVGANLYYNSIDRNSDGNGVDDPSFHDWFKTATLATQPYLVPDESAQAMRYISCAARRQDIRESVYRCQKIMEKQGMEVLVLDQTRPDIELPVAKVIVPGLRHFWARFAPGRLYDVPVMLGWHPQQLTETQLNPIPMFL